MAVRCAPELPDRIHARFTAQRCEQLCATGALLNAYITSGEMSTGSLPNISTLHQWKQPHCTLTIVHSATITALTVHPVRSNPIAMYRYSAHRTCAIPCKCIYSIHCRRKHFFRVYIQCKVHKNSAAVSGPTVYSEGAHTFVNWTYTVQ